MTSESCTQLILEFWGQQGWQLDMDARAEGLATFIAPRRYNEDGRLTFAGGPRCDFPERVEAVCKLVNARQTGSIDAEAYRIGLYRSLPFLTTETRDALAGRLAQ